MKLCNRWLYYECVSEKCDVLDLDASAAKAAKSHVYFNVLFSIYFFGAIL